MNKSYKNETITAYLLGSLPEREAEIFDELSFTDDDFADELKAAEKDLVDAYVNDELRGTTLEQFKSFYLASPLRRKKVEFARSFQKFAEEKLQTEVSESKENIVKVETKPSGFLAALNTFTTPRPSLQWGFALLALLFMGLAAWLIFENSRLQNQFGVIEAKRIELQQREKQLQEEITGQRSADLEKEKELSNVRGEIVRLEKELEQKRVTEQEQNRKRIAEPEIADVKKQTPEPRRNIVAAFVLTPQLRGNNQLQTLTLPAKTDTVAMRLELESDDYPNYRVALKNQENGRILWQSGKIKSKNKTLNIGFPANLLKAQIYSLQVSGISSDGASEIISDYSFRIMR
jgi:hypothetical protein